MQKSRVRDSCVRVKVCEALLRFWKSHEKSQVRDIEIGLGDFVKPSHCTQIRFQVQSFSTSHNPSSQSSKQNSKILPAFLHQIITPNIRQPISIRMFRQMKNPPKQKICQRNQGSVPSKSVSLQNFTWSRS